MEENKTSVLSNGLIWFGAGVSMSERFGNNDDECAL